MPADILQQYLLKNWTNKYCQFEYIPRCIANVVDAFSKNWTNKA